MALKSCKIQPCVADILNLDFLHCFSLCFCLNTIRLFLRQWWFSHEVPPFSEVIVVHCSLLGHGWHSIIKHTYCVGLRCQYNIGLPLSLIYTMLGRQLKVVALVLFVIVNYWVLFQGYQPPTLSCGGQPTRERTVTTCHPKNSNAEGATYHDTNSFILIQFIHLLTCCMLNYTCTTG